MNLAWKELIYQRKKYALIELVIVLLMFMVLFLSGLANGLGRAVDSSVADSGANYFVVSDTSEDLLTVSSLSESVVNKVKAAEDKSNDIASLDVMRSYIQKEKEKDKVDITYFAIEKGSFLEPMVVSGKNLDKSSYDNPIVLDDDYMDKGFKIGEKIYDSSVDKTFTISGFTKDKMYGHVSVGYITRADFEVLAKKLMPLHSVPTHALAIKGKDTVSKLELDGVKVDTKKQIIDKLPGYKAEQTTINMITWVLVVVSSAIIGVFYYIITLQKEREFGVMKAIGVSMMKISNVICSQVIMVAGFGVVIANILAFAMAAVLPNSMPFYLEAANAAMVSVVFVFISLLASLLSLVRVAKVDPVTAIGGVA